MNLRERDFKVMDDIKSVASSDPGDIESPSARYREISSPMRPCAIPLIFGPKAKASPSIWERIRDWTGGIIDCVSKNPPNDNQTFELTLDAEFLGYNPCQHDSIRLYLILNDNTPHVQVIFS